MIAPSAFRWAVAWIVVSLAAWPAAAQKSDPFYSTLVEDGIRSFERRDYLRASEDLRIASFGLLENPPELARAIAYLALAQGAAGNREGFERSYRRLTDLESRFQAYSAAALTADARSALEQVVRSHFGTAGLDGSTSTGAEEPTMASAPVTRPQLCISWAGTDDCREVTAVAEQTAPEVPDLPDAEKLASFDRLDRLASGKASGQQLRRGFEEAAALAALYPDWTDMQSVAAVLASRSGSFAEAVHYYELAGEQAEDGPLQLFYLSVALFETDQPEAAATVLRRALPALEQNREVRRYVRRILSEESAG